MRLEGAARDEAEANDVAGGGCIMAAMAAADDEDGEVMSGLASGDGVGMEAGGEMLPAACAAAACAAKWCPREGELEGSVEEEAMDLDS